jgi:hypothetical protein
LAEVDISLSWHELAEVGISWLHKPKLAEVDISLSWHELAEVGISWLKLI